MIKRYKSFQFEESIDFKIGDKVKIKKARTSGGKSFDIIITRIVNKKIVKGKILNGPLAGYTETGEVIELL